MDRTGTETPKAIAIIQARCSSTRLPGKVLKPLAGKPMIWHIAKRAESCEHVDQVVVATSTESSDDHLAEFCEQAGLGCFRGSLSNVLSSVHLAVIRLQQATTEQHRQVFEGLRAAGIGVQLHYSPVHLQPYYRALGFTEGQFPEAEAYASSAISLPLFPGLLPADQQQVADQLTQALHQAEVLT